MSTIRILHVSQPTTAGVPQAVVQLAVHQLDAGWDVSVACPPGGTLAARLADLTVPTLRWDAAREPGAATWNEVGALRTIIDDADPTVVHLHSSKAGLAGRLALRGARATVFQPNAWSFLPPGRSQRPARAWERFAARWTDLFVVVSERERQLAHEVGIQGRFHLARNGVDTAAFRFATDADRTTSRRELGLASRAMVVCVGRLCAQKGQLPLVRKWDTVRARVPGAQLVLVGSGPDRDAIEAERAAGVQLVGEQQDVRPWLAAADVVVQPSRWEGQSFATVEAMAVGRAVVAFDVEGMRDALGDVGRVVRPGDVAALANAVTDLLEDPDERVRLGTLARRRAETDFDVALTCADVTEQTLDVVSARRRSFRHGTEGPSAARSTRETSAAGRPTFLLIGAARSGTTFLAHHLGRHPDVHMSEPKEPHFLAYGGAGDVFRGPGDETVLTRASTFDEATWRAMFPGQVVAQGEGSVSTLYRPDRAIPRIQSLCPDAKLLVALRDPVDRAYSAWAYQVSRGFEVLSFGDALEAESARIADNWQHMWHYVAMSRYTEQLAPFIDAFGRDRIIVLDYDELVRDPQRVLDRCFAFVGVDELAITGLRSDVNAGGQPRSELVLRAMKAARAIDPVRRAVRSAVPFGIRERIRSANLRADVIAPEVRAQLDEVFAAERNALVSLLGSDAPAWATTR